MQNLYKSILIKIGGKFNFNFFAVIFYKVSLDLFIYFAFLALFCFPVATSLDVTYIKVIESYLLLSVIYFAAPRIERTASQAMVWMLLLFSYIPMLAVFACCDKPRAYIYAITGFWLTVFFFLRKASGFFPEPLRQLKTRLAYYILFVLLYGATFLLIYKFFGLSLNLDFNKAYEIRFKFVALEKPLLNYLFPWMAYIINPIFLATFLKFRKWPFLILTVILQLLIFSVTGQRIYLFPFLLVPFLFLTSERKYFLAIVATVFSLLTIAGAGLYFLIGNPWVASLFTARTLLTPAMISFSYYDFFSKHGFVFLSSLKFFKSFLTYPYDLSPPNLIGKLYYRNPLAHANTGIVGDAYMNMGPLGLFIWGIILVVFLKLMDFVSQGKDIRIVAAAVVMPALVLTNGALFTSFLSHGLMLVPLFLYLIPRKDL